MSGNMSLFGWKDNNSDLATRITALEKVSSVSLPSTTKGDLITRNSTTNTRLAVGFDTNSLLADSATPTGLRWGQINHLNLNNIGTNTHAQIDTAISNMVSLNGTETLANKTLTTPIIGAILNGGQTINIPSGISSIMALQSAGAVTTGNICNYFNTKVIQDSGVALTSMVTLTGTQTLTNKTIADTANTITIGGTNITSLINQDI